MLNKMIDILGGYGIIDHGHWLTWFIDNLVHANGSRSCGMHDTS